MTSWNELLSQILNKDLMKTSSIRAKDDRGRHTTTIRKMVILNNGCKIIDTPGIRSIGMIDLNEAIDEYFIDITSFRNKCKYKNCMHISEQGCFVKKALMDGEI